MRQLLDEEKSINFSAFSEKVGEINKEFNNRFADFELLKANVELSNNQIEVDAETQLPYF